MGLSNKAISEKLSIPVKTIERILNELNKKFANKAKAYNPRVRLLACLIYKGVLDISTEQEQRFISDLNENLSRTLALCCIGFSNKAIAEIFDLSEKAIELRFSQLFDYFNVDTKNQNLRNPRISLFISAYCRGNIKKTQIQRLFKETMPERLDNVFDQPETFIKNLEAEYKYIG